ncbi:MULTISPECIES: histidine triad nucleotide-binding protein [unclassified Undibacterium]|uniref:histidine triad nucleotide-binding protein n=1 Tax=unclassified Undibacterium TaxID=2630295 RepID=UPI002AC95981|nr:MULTISPECIES: histidine triad nucleotide-binding protein [unclassified Undibacterium]MEB0139732.1 histidine triad nucleotide-binding protein [Undibacterium sp. CCC2.1]MEB0172613.1 histidine triad nucleotide-binding protein [Undibacterium sp. CCC1.1]MEB0176406.1 histidine triad nucleotide-binding protein [Undibacterium sp. CCC3.4]MEB0215736.1 histidine triad nucleotide-binding protein [Undibacterium sp. 5I2]WPX45159.1 histidine triad nucleotide-binding protein [Undibacterium sp. CCC3.4]
MENCIFCKIAAKHIPASIVHEDADLLAFKDINPAAPVHLLIIPKQHIDTLSAATVEHSALLGKMLALVPQLAAAHGCAPQLLADGTRSGGYKTLINTGPDGGQEVYHLHMHVIGGALPWRGQR